MHTAGLRQLHTTHALVPCRRVVQYVGARPLSSAFPTAKIICFNRIRGRLCSRVRKAASGNCETPSDASSNDGGGNAGGGNKEPQQFDGHEGDDGKPNHARLYPLWLRVIVLSTGALYAVAIRPRLFQEREEQRKHIEREVAQYDKYEEDWLSFSRAYTHTSKDALQAAAGAGEPQAAHSAKPRQ